MLKFIFGNCDLRVDKLNFSLSNFLSHIEFNVFYKFRFFCVFRFLDQPFIVILANFRASRPQKWLCQLTLLLFCIAFSPSEIYKIIKNIRTNYIAVFIIYLLYKKKILFTFYIKIILFTNLYRNKWEKKSFYSKMSKKIQNYQNM